MRFRSKEYIKTDQHNTRSKAIWRRAKEVRKGRRSLLVRAGGGQFHTGRDKDKEQEQEDLCATAFQGGVASAASPAGARPGESTVRRRSARNRAQIMWGIAAQCRRLGFHSE